jgi:hypothetical protein
MVVICQANKIFQTYTLTRNVVVRTDDGQNFDITCLTYICEGPGYFIAAKNVRFVYFTLIFIL